MTERRPLVLVDGRPAELPSGDTIPGASGGDATNGQGWFWQTERVRGPKGNTGERGPQGSTGAPGTGVPAGGTTGQVLRKTGVVDFDANWVDFAHAADHRHGGTDEIATATAAANAIPKADASGKLDTWISDASTSAKGKVQLATDGGTTAGTAVQATDTRMANARTPTAHATSHKNGGTDEIATATAAANAIPKADANGKLDTWVSDASTSAKGKVQLAADGGTTAGTAVQATDTRMANARTPTAHASSHAPGGTDPITFVNPLPLMWWAAA